MRILEEHEYREPHKHPKLTGGLFMLMTALSNCAEAQTDAKENPSTTNPQPTKETVKNNSLYEVLAGELALQSDDYKEALSHYSTAIQNSNDPELAAKATALAIANNDSEQALKNALIWVKLAPDNLRANGVIATLYLKEKKPEAAVIYLKKIVTNPDEDTALSYLQLIQNAMEVPPEHIAFKEALQSLLKENTGVEKRIWYTIASNAFEQADTKTAQEAMQNTFQIAPTWTPAILLQLQYDYQNEPIDEAIHFMQALIKKYPNNHEILWVYSQLLLDIKDFDSAYPVFKTLEKDPKYSEQAMMGLVETYIGKKDFNNAEIELKKVITNNPNNSDPYYFLGLIKEQAGDTANARKLYAKVDKGTFYLPAQMAWSVLTAQAGDLDKATDNLDHLHIQTKESAMQVLLLKVQLQLAGNHNLEAYDTLNTLMDYAPNNMDLFYLHGILAERINDIPQAEKDLNTVLKNDPKNVHAMNALIHVLLIHRNSLKEAEPLVEKVLQLSPDDPETLDNAGLLFYQKGDLSQAKNYFQKAYALSDDPEIAANLSQVLWQQGDHQNALSVLNKAIKQYPDETGLKDLKSKFLESK